MQPGCISTASTFFPRAPARREYAPTLAPMSKAMLPAGPCEIICVKAAREGLNSLQMVAPAPFQMSKALDRLQLRPSPKHGPHRSKRWAERWAARLGGRCVADEKHKGHFQDRQKMCLSAKQVSVSCSVCWYEGNMCRYAVSWAGAEDKAEGTVPGGLGSVAERAVSVLWMARCVCVRTRHRGTSTYQWFDAKSQTRPQTRPQMYRW